MLRLIQYVCIVAGILLLVSLAKAQTSQLTTTARDRQSINVTVYKPDTDKRARVIAQSDLFVGGSVRFPRRAAWLEELTAELLAFPGRHDDQVDALTQGLAWGRVRRGEVSVQHIRGLY